MVCLITGSSRGLGRAIALSLGQRGNRIVVHFRERRSEAQAVASMLSEAMVLKADVRDPAEVRALIDDVIKKWGRIDVLVNNAGITKELLLIRTSEQQFNEVIDTNLKGAFNCIRAVAPVMTAQRSGHIVNISSYAGVKGRTGLSAYSASKAGLIGLTMSAARELGDFNVMVNAVLPGYMLTDMGSAPDDRARALAMQDSPIKKYSEPDRVAAFICCLLGSQGITGQVFNIDSRML